MNIVGLQSSKRKRRRALVVLCMGRGSIYILPYLSSYLYIPMKEAMGLDNTQLGLMTSAMGFTAMIFYWPGGWVADRFPAFPSFSWLLVIQLLMGAFLSLTYWSALIKATRELGGYDEQGKCFGFLEGGRN
jgi:MFS family permease